MKSLNVSLTSNKQPQISVVMPVYNGGRFIATAIESIFNQTYWDFEFVIVDDGSTDNTADIINSLKDSRIKLVKNAQNVGLQRALNIGLKAATGKYIARMDADDESLPDRLKLQKEFLDKYSNIACVGARIMAFTDDKDLKKSWRPKNSTGTKFLSLFETPIFHPTAMCRAEIIKKYRYNESLPRSEDYDIWSRMLADGLKITNLSQPLLKYRIHKESFTKKAGKTNLDTVANITLQNMQRYIGLSQQEIKAVKKYRSGYPLSLDQWFVFSILCVKLFFKFLHKEQVGLKEISTLLRIIISLIFRIIRRSTPK